MYKVYLLSRDKRFQDPAENNIVWCKSFKYFKSMCKFVTKTIDANKDKLGYNNLRVKTQSVDGWCVDERAGHYYINE